MTFIVLELEVVIVLVGFDMIVFSCIDLKFIV